MAHLGGEMKSLLLTLAIMLFDDHLCNYQYCIDHSAQISLLHLIELLMVWRVMLVEVAQKWVCLCLKSSSIAGDDFLDYNLLTSFSECFSRSDVVVSKKTDQMPLSAVRRAHKRIPTGGRCQGCKKQ